MSAQREMRTRLIRAGHSRFASDLRRDPNDMSGFVKEFAPFVTYLLNRDLLGVERVQEVQPVS